MRKKSMWIVGLFGFCCVCGAEEKITIAHRGASGYLPEHTLAAKAMAYAMGADYIEQDVVMTKDDRLVVLHDHYLDRVTDVAKKFPERSREDGRFYAIDFTLDEIRGLEMTEGFKVKKEKQVQVFPDRFPMWRSSFHVHTLEEEIEMIQGLNISTGKDIGIYPEIKNPEFHHSEGRDISMATLKVLKEYGYATKNDRVYVQCFEPLELQRIHDELFPMLGIDLKLVQLIGRFKVGNTGKSPPNWILEPGGMAKVSEYADGIGPSCSLLVDKNSPRTNLVVTDMVKEAHAAGLVVHPYTFRVEQVPAYADSFEDMLTIFFNQVGVDGVFSDFPDRIVRFLRSCE